MSDEAKPYTTEEARVEAERYYLEPRTATTLRAYADMLAEVGKVQDVLREAGCDAEVTDVFAAASLYPRLNSIINDRRTEITAQGERIERLRAALKDIRETMGGDNPAVNGWNDPGAVWGWAGNALKEDDSHGV